MRRLLLLASAGLACACSSAPTKLDVDVTVGLEKGAFEAAPAVTEVDVTATSLSGDKLTAKTKPGGSFDLGDVTPTDPYTIDVTGLSAAGEVVMQGRSLALSPDAIDGSTFPVFCERVDAWARPPAGLDAAHVGGATAIAAERFLMLAGGSKALDANGASVSTSQAEFYDLATLAGGTSSVDLPIVPSTVLGLGDAALLIAEHDAQWLGFSDGTAEDAGPPPTGMTSWSDVAGGREVDAPDGRVFLVGAGRGAAATRGVLVLGTDGSSAALELAHARAGAAVAWVDNVGIVIAGGAPGAPGVEVLADGASSFTERPFPPDGVTGAAVGAAASGVFLVGGVDASGAPAPTRRIDPTCTTGCAASEEKDLALPIGIVGARLFELDGSRLLAVGEEAKGGHARAFEVDVGAKRVTEIPLREPRAGASFVPAPNGTLAVLGGVHDDGSPALHVEMLFPR